MSSIHVTQHSLQPHGAVNDVIALFHVSRSVFWQKVILATELDGVAAVVENHFVIGPDLQLKCAQGSFKRAFVWV